MKMICLLLMFVCCLVACRLFVWSATRLFGLKYYLEQKGIIGLVEKRKQQKNPVEEAEVQQLLEPDGGLINEIEQLVKEESITMLEAVIHVCEKRNLEIEQVAASIKKSGAFKKKFQDEAKRLHMVKS
jgi:tRNA isopentenyl-2-thiomethyl-A-37 hydroxylase MiaE